MPTEAQLKYWKSKIGKSTWNKGKCLSEKHRHNLSISHLGKNNTLGKRWKIKDVSKHSKTNGFKKGHRINLGSHRSEQVKEKLRIQKLGRKNPMWKNGISFEPYTTDWTKILKFKIRNRDNFICQKCGITEEEHLIKFNRVLSVNHIDFNKSNCKENNLNTLCCVCNSFINSKREYWTNYFNNKLKIYG